MRDYAPFCPVCAGVIRAILQPFQPAESITLVTPSISFTNVPSGMGGVGVTTHRAIRWDVVTCRNLTFQITAGPTGGFGTPFGTSAVVSADPIVPAAAARIWLSYTSTNPGDVASGSVTVQCVETGESWVDQHQRQHDRAATHGGVRWCSTVRQHERRRRRRRDQGREAARGRACVHRRHAAQRRHRLVRFNDTAQRIMEVEDAGAAPGGAGRVNALTHIDGNELDPSGATSIGDGVVNGRDMLDDAQAAPTPDYDGTAMVVLTDGQWNTPPSLATVSGSINASTYAVGSGLPSNISVPALTTLCQGHNGYLLITGALTADQSMRLSKYFLQILAGVTNAQIAADPAGVLDSNSEHRIPFWICEADFGMDLIVLSPYPYAIDFQLEAPDGSLIDPSSGAGGANAQFVLTNRVAYYRCALPVLPANENGSHAGRWHAVLRLGEERIQVGYIYDRQVRRPTRARASVRVRGAYLFQPDVRGPRVAERVSRSARWRKSPRRCSSTPRCHRTRDCVGRGPEAAVAALTSSRWLRARAAVTWRAIPCRCLASTHSASGRAAKPCMACRSSGNKH